MQKRTKLLLGGLSTSAVVAGVALTGGTSAYLYDLEQQNNNAFRACGFNLTYDIASEQTGSGVDGGSQADVNETGAVRIANVEPGDEFTVNVGLDNSGTCAGDLWADMDQHFDQENSLTEPEQDANDVPEGNPAGSAQTDPYDETQRSGELGDYLQVTLYRNGTQVFPTVSEPAKSSIHDLAVWFPERVDGDFVGGDHVDLKAVIKAPESADRAAENQIMTDSYEFELDFALAQQGYMPDGTIDLSGGLANAGTSTP